MMPINFEGANLRLTRPANMTDEECADIDAYKGVYDDSKMPFIATCLQPSKEDIEAIIAGRPIWVHTMGHSFVPMMVFTLDENNNANI